MMSSLSVLYGTNVEIDHFPDFFAPLRLCVISLYQTLAMISKNRLGTAVRGSRDSTHPTRVTRIAICCLTVWLCLTTPAVVLGQQEAAYQGKTVGQWVADLEARDVPTRWYAAYALGRIGPQAAGAVDSLCTVLENKGEDEYVRGGAAWALGRIPAAAEPAVGLLADTLQSMQHVSVRRNSARALGNIGQPATAAIPALERLLDDPDPAVGANAAAALWKIDRHPKAVPALIAMLSRPLTSGPYNAAVALGEIGPDARAAVPALVGAFSHHSRDVHRSAARALGQIGPVCIPALLPALNAPSPRVRQNALEALRWLGPPAVPALIDALINDDPQVRITAARILGDLGPAAKEASEALEKALKDPDPQVRKIAGRALSQLNSKTNRPDQQ